MKSSAEIKLITLIILVATSGFFGSCQTKRASSAVPTANIQPQSAQSGEVPSPDTDSYRKIADGLSAALKGYNQTKPQTHQTLPVPSDPQKLADSIEKNGETAAALTNVALAEQAIKVDASTDNSGSTGGMMWLPFISNTHLEEVGIGASVVAVSIAVGLVAVSQYRYWKVRQVFQTNKQKLQEAQKSLDAEIEKQKNDPDFLREKAAQEAKIATAQAEVRRLEASAATKASDLAAARQNLNDLTAAHQRLQGDHEAKARLLSEAQAIVIEANAQVDRARLAITELSKSDAALDRELVDHEARVAAARQLSEELDGKVQPLTEAESAAQAHFRELEDAKVAQLAEQRAKVDAALETANTTRAEERRLRQLVHPELQKEADVKAELPPKGWFEWVTGPSPERADILRRLGTASAEAERVLENYTRAKQTADTALEEYERIKAAAEAANKTAEVAALRGQGALADLSRQVVEARAAVDRAKSNVTALEQGIAERRASSGALKARVAAENLRLDSLNRQLAARRDSQAALHREQVAAGSAQAEAQARTAAQATEVERLAREKAFADREKGLATDRLTEEGKVKPKAASEGVDRAQAMKDTFIADQARTSKLLEGQAKKAKGFGIAGALFGTVGIGILVPSVVGLSKGGLGLAQDDARARLLSDLQGLELRWQKLYGKKILEAEAAQKK